MAMHIEQPDCRHSAPACLKIRSSPSASACNFTACEPGTTRVPALRDGAWSRAPVGAGLCRHRQGSAKLVRLAQRLRRLQSDFLLQFHAQPGQRYEPGLRLGSPVEFERLRLRRWRRLWRRRILGWRFWRRRRKRVLVAPASRWLCVGNTPHTITGLDAR